MATGETVEIVGVFSGTVDLRPGESREDAVARADAVMFDLFNCQAFGGSDGVKLHPGGCRVDAPPPAAGGE